MSDIETRQIVLSAIQEERRHNAALFLSACFSLPICASRDIAASSPVMLLSELSTKQAEAVMIELLASAPEGVILENVRTGETSGINQLQWPQSPRIFGRDLAEFDAIRLQSTTNCPHCGGRIRVTELDRILRVEAADSPFMNTAAAKRNETIERLQGNNGIAPGDPALLGSQPPNGGLSGRFAFMKRGAFAVMLGRTKDVQVIRIVSEIMGIPENEAREKCQTPGLCVAKDISLAEAQSLLARFKNIGVKVRIAKPA
ncbi:MAG: hypothetical protein LBE84_11760 [Planctomycetota bacterium]|nr:hypothetical protein [Planctomycetota bacterium]